MFHAQIIWKQNWRVCNLGWAGSEKLFLKQEALDWL
jgi:hypothetical protein